MTTAVLVDFFSKHYILRWRQAMNEYCMAAWPRLRHIEGAAQRVQEDTMRFARTMEDLGLSFMRSLMTLAAFLPVLWALSDKVTATTLVEAKKQGAVLAWGNFLTLVLNFIIVAWVLFLVIRGMTRMMRKEEEKAPALSKQEQLLTEIRDLLKAR